MKMIVRYALSRLQGFKHVHHLFRLSELSNEASKNASKGFSSLLHDVRPRLINVSFLCGSFVCYLKLSVNNG